MKNKKLLCGIAFNYHDSSVSFALDDKILLVLEAERVFREKKKGCNSREMEELIRFGLNLLNKNEDDVAYWTLCTLMNPWLEEKDRYPKPPVWKNINILGKKRISLIINHHLAHASTFLFSPMNKAKILTCDGGGDYGERVTIYDGNGISLTKEDINVNNFITAKPYELCATYLYNSPMCEGKLMALAAYGTPTKEYISILEDLLSVLCTTNYKNGDEILSKTFPRLKGKASSSNIEACNFSASIQDVFVRHRIRDINQVIEKFKNPNLVLVGGSCLNLEVNTEIWRTLDSILTFIPPCCDDTGQSLGALSYLITEIFGLRPKVKLPYLGYGEQTFKYSKETVNEIVDRILNNQIILMHNGKAEIGPRALGNRSFLARPDDIKIKEVLSQGIKGREDYRPLAPVVLEDKVHLYFIGPDRSPYMLYQYYLKDSIINLLAGCIHYDGTVRVQSLNKEYNKFLYEIIKRFGEKTGIYALINTSLNLKGEPITNTLGDTLNISKKIKSNHTIVYNGDIIK